MSMKSKMMLMMALGGLVASGTTSGSATRIKDLDLRVTDAQRAMVKPMKLSKKAKAKLKKELQKK